MRSREDDIIEAANLQSADISPKTVLQTILSRTYGGLDKYADELRSDIDAVPPGASQRIAIHNKFLDGVLRYGAEPDASTDNIDEMKAVLEELIEANPLLKQLKKKMPNLAEELLGGVDD